MSLLDEVDDDGLRIQREQRKRKFQPKSLIDKQRPYFPDFKVAIDKSSLLSDIQRQGLETRVREHLYGERIDWTKVCDIDGSVVSLSDMSEETEGHEKVKESLTKLVIVKINLDEGEDMEFFRPMCDLEARDGFTVLDLIVKQIKYLYCKYDCMIPLVLINSLSTQDFTTQVIEDKYKRDIDIRTVCLESYPQLGKCDLRVLPRQAPPHGSHWFFTKLPLNLLKVLTELCCIRARTRQSNQFELKFLNTNNMWANLKAVKRLSEDTPMRVGVYSETKRTALEFRTAAASAIELFDRTLCVSVDYMRSFSLKKTSHLLLLRSNIFTMEESGICGPNVHLPLPHILLDPPLHKVEVFNEYFKVVPDISELKSLHVTGRAIFREGVVLKGSVRIACEVKYLLKNLTIVDDAIDKKKPHVEEADDVEEEPDMLVPEGTSTESDPDSLKTMSSYGSARTSDSD